MQRFESKWGNEITRRTQILIEKREINHRAIFGLSPRFENVKLRQNSETRFIGPDLNFADTENYLARVEEVLNKESN